MIWWGCAGLCALSKFLTFVRSRGKCLALRTSPRSIDIQSSTEASSRWSQSRFSLSPNFATAIKTSDSSSDWWPSQMLSSTPRFALSMTLRKATQPSRQATIRLLSFKNSSATKDLPLSIICAPAGPSLWSRLSTIQHPMENRANLAVCTRSTRIISMRWLYSTLDKSLLPTIATWISQSSALVAYLVTVV